MFSSNCLSFSSKISSMLEMIFCSSSSSIFCSFALCSRTSWIMASRRPECLSLHLSMVFFLFLSADQFGETVSLFIVVFWPKYREQLWKVNRHHVRYDPLSNRNNTVLVCSRCSNFPTSRRHVDCTRERSSRFLRSSRSRDWHTEAKRCASRCTGRRKCF